MSALILARWQFALTTVYHFFFVPLTIGLVIMIATMETVYVRSGNELYKKMAQFWGRLLLINFALGVATGILQEFQFGMNWSTYSRYVGDVFGAPLAVEALLAFYLESTFLGIWMFGWDKLPKKLHLATIWLVAVGSCLSAYWILVANSFMQNPVGYTIKNGRAEMTNIFALIANPNVLVQFPHVFFAALVTGAFFVLGISAFHLWRQKHPDLSLFQQSFRLALGFAVVASVLVAVVGHVQAQQMVRIQPMKMAAAEALWNSENPAALSLFTIGDTKDRKDVFAIHIPDLLTILAYNNVQGEVQGINQLQAEYVKEYGPGNYVPDVPLIYWSFRAMVGSGVLMILLALYGAFLIVRRRSIELQRKYLLALVGAMALPYLANTTGWLMTELGRQPWIVQGLLKTSQAVSPTVGAGAVLLSLIVFVVLYGVLMGADTYLLARYAGMLPARFRGKADEGESTEIEEAELVEAY